MIPAAIARALLAADCDVLILARGEGLLEGPDQQELLHQQRNLKARLLHGFMSRVNPRQEALQWLTKRLDHPRRRMMDQVTKRPLYERPGVQEYWLIHPTDRLLPV